MKDVRGNVLKKGDSVLLELPKPQVVGKVHEIMGGSVLAVGRGGQSRVSPAYVEVMCLFRIPVDPTNRVAEVLVKIYDPDLVEARRKLHPSHRPASSLCNKRLTPRVTTV